MNGAYHFVYSGDIGVGMGVFTVTDGTFVGIDLGGVRYRGLVKEDPNSGEIELTFDMTVPAGITLVQGTSPQGVPITRHAPAQKIPPAFGNGAPFKIEVPPGFIWVMVKRTTDDCASWVNAVRFQITPLSA
jgi:hypothetical protein